MNQLWFEMNDLRKRKLDNSVWVPLRAKKSIRNDIAYGKNGYQDEFEGHASLMIPIDKKAETEDLDWEDIGINNDQGLNFIFGEYSQSDLYASEDFKGI